jgi:cell division protein FtsI/penicillin-binding protein 2
MERCVKSGTGKLSDPGNMIGVGGKTGTAGEQEGHNTVWFTGFFPVSNPKFAMTVLLEDATSGASDAAPLFGKIAAEIMNQK